MSGSWNTRREAGSASGIAIVAWVARLLGRRAVAVFLLPVVLYFMIVRGEERRASKQFLGRLLDREPHFWEVFRHFHTFARVASDRLFILTNRMDKLDVVVHGKPLLQSIADQGVGCMILSSHLGSFEATRAASFSRPDIELHILIDRSLNPNFQQRLETFDPMLASRIIDASQPPASFALQIANVLRNGGWIGIPADRFMSGARTVSCDFMGSAALFPSGPFILATTFNMPVVFATGLFLDGRYHLHFESLVKPHVESRGQRMEAVQALAQSYSDRLETYARIAPYNWFNFYDFWAR